MRVIHVPILLLAFLVLLYAADRMTTRDLPAPPVRRCIACQQSLVPSGDQAPECPVCVVLELCSEMKCDAATTASLVELARTLEDGRRGMLDDVSQRIFDELIAHYAPTRM